MTKLILHKKSYFDNVVIITGVHCSGKSMLSPVVCSLKKVEPIRKILTVDQIIHLTSVKKIELSTASFLIKQLLDKHFYEQLIGRNTNLRPDDETSIFIAKNTNEMINRIFLKRGPKIINKHRKQKTIFAMDSHDAIMFFDIWKNINKKFKFINIYRNPIDTVASWLKHGMGKMDEILINEYVMFKHQRKVFPIYQVKNFIKYKKLNEIDKIISMVLYCMESEYKNYKKNKNSKNCLFLEFNDFASKTHIYLEKIQKFLKTEVSEETKKIMKRENCPRIINENTYDENFKKIKKLSSKKYFQKLINFEKIYFLRKNNKL